MNMRVPVGIAGIGAVCGAGDNIDQILACFRSGQVQPAAKLPFESSIVCPTFQVQSELPALHGPQADSRTLRLAMAAVNQALRDAELVNSLRQSRVGVCLGTTVACQLNSIPFYAAYRRGETPDLAPIRTFLSSNLASAVAQLLDVSPTAKLTVVNACSSGTDAIGVAAGWIAGGLCDVAIAGGADELHRVALSGFCSLGVVSSQLCMPFDRDRSGLNLGEGAGIVVLESAGHAEARGKSHRIEVAGFGAACDGHHLTAPHPEGRGLSTAIELALSQAGVTPNQIAFINAHGTATLDNDRAEGKVLGRIFGPDARILSTKGYTGHTLGAAGGLEAVFTILGLRERWIPRSAGFEHRAEDVPFSPVQQMTEITGQYAMSTSLAFGGNNSALVLRRRR